eukprot:TRINITY_DN7180_c0_g1_i1.p1 TRINITY_DN7180_c0_g1~~TRINITY_DN7180_c0_g1_i1.p1  ORF type:complete len:355 (+),score=55.94 TRINITY_DN7180_c0_g1_i1:194-1258(+)
MVFSSFLGGYPAAIIAVLSFGALPVYYKGRNVSSIVIHFYLCIGALIIVPFGLLEYCSTAQFSLVGIFEPLALISVILFQVQDLLAVVVVQNLGMSLGVSLWSGLGIILTFIFGRISKEPLVKPIWVLFLGVTVCCFGTFSFAFVETTMNSNSDNISGDPHSSCSSPEKGDFELSPTVTIADERIDTPDLAENVANLEDSSKIFVPNKKKGYLALLIFVFSNTTIFIPSMYAKNVFSFVSTFGFFNIIVASGIYLFVAFILHRDVKCESRHIIWFVLCGVQWGVAYFCSQFVFNPEYSDLGMSIGGPFMNLSIVVCNLLGIYVFKEIKGLKNILIVFVGMFVILVGSFIIGSTK